MENIFNDVLEFVENDDALVADLLIGLALAIFVVDLLMSVLGLTAGIYGTIRTSLLPIVLLGGVVGVLMRILGFQI